MKSKKFLIKVQKDKGRELLFVCKKAGELPQSAVVRQKICEALADSLLKAIKSKKQNEKIKQKEAVKKNKSKR